MVVLSATRIAQSSMREFLSSLLFSGSPHGWTTQTIAGTLPINDHTSNYLSFITLYTCYSFLLHYCISLTLPSVRSLQGPLLNSPQILSSQHSPSANSYPFGAGSGLVLTWPTDDRCSHPSLPRKDGSDRLQKVKSLASFSKQVAPV
jgi:hypothetical protein